MVAPHAAHPKKIYDPQAHPELDENRPPRAWVVPLLGLVFVALLAVSIGLTANGPQSNASGASVIAYYTDHKDRATISGLMTAISIPAGLFFFGLLREYLHASRAVRPYSIIALAGAIVFAVGGCIQAGLTISLTDVPTQLSTSAAQALNVLSSDMGAGLFIGGLSTMQFAFGIAFLVGKAFPKWLGWLSIVIGVVCLLGPLVFFGLIATGVWVLIVSAMIYPRLRDSGKLVATTSM